MKYYRTEKQRLYYEKVITLYRDQHMGKTRIAKIIPVSDWTISNWIRTFVAENPQYKSKRMKYEEEKRKRRMIENSLQSPLPNDKQSLQSEVARLRKALREASMRADLYDEMINVAEKQFNISIRKKSWHQAVTNLHARDKDKYPIETQCRLLGVSKQAYFQRDEDVLLRRMAQEEFALSYILEMRRKDCLLCVTKKTVIVIIATM